MGFRDRRWGIEALVAAMFLAGGFIVSGFASCLLPVLGGYGAALFLGLWGGHGDSGDFWISFWLSVGASAGSAAGFRYVMGPPLPYESKVYAMVIGGTLAMGIAGYCINPVVELLSYLWDDISFRLFG